MQADTIVAQPGNPQGLNRYTYTNNNPMRYVDPSGHCADVESNDPVCWAIYRRAAGMFGSTAPTDLWMWSIDQLSHLQGWLQRGIRFTGQQWQPSNVDWVVQGLDLLQNALGTALTNDIYGVAGGGVFPMNNITGQTPAGDENVPAWGDRKGILWNFGAKGDPLPTFTYNVIHETGHVVDTQAGALLYGGGFWSTQTPGWLTGSGWMNHKIDPSATGPDQWVLGGTQDIESTYARSNPVEDFAETFKYHVLVERDKLNVMEGVPGGDRLPRLQDALDLLR